MKNKIDIFILLFILSVFSCKNVSKTDNTGVSKKAITQKADPNNLGVDKTVNMPIATNAIKPDTVIKSSFDNPVAIANNKYNPNLVNIKTRLVLSTA